jgi:hypothetical protein
MLRSGHPGLRYQGCFGLAAGTPKGVFFICVWSQLETLDLTWCDIDVTAVSYLVQAQWPHLKALGLSGNDINVDTLDLLVEAQWPLLTELDLSRNYLGPGPVVRLSSGHELPLNDGQHIVTPPAWLLKQWPGLRVLNLSYCNLKF